MSLVKKIITKGLVATLTMGTILGGNTITASSTAPHEIFSDVEDGAWYEDTLEAVISEGIINGYADGTFKGTDSMTIDQFIKTMVVAIDGEQALGTDYWASEYIARAIELDLIEGNTFDDYTETIIRAEMAMIAENTLIQLEGEYDYSYTKLISQEIEDMDDVEESGYEDAVVHMYEQGILKGYPDGEYKPFDGLKRQEAITIIERVIDVDSRSAYTIDLSHVSYWSDELLDACEESGIIPFQVRANGENTDLLLTDDNLREIQEEIDNYKIIMYQVGSFYGPEGYTGEYEVGINITMGFTSDENQMLIIEQCFTEIMQNYVKLDDSEIEKIMEYYEYCNDIYVEKTASKDYNINFGEKEYFYDKYGRQLYTVSTPFGGGLRIMGSYDVE